MIAAVGEDRENREKLVCRSSRRIIRRLVFEGDRKGAQWGLCQLRCSASCNIVKLVSIGVAKVGQERALTLPPPGEGKK